MLRCRGTRTRRICSIAVESDLSVCGCADFRSKFYREWYAL